ncbi:MAG: STAS domain-containing protein [Mycobacterium sp.]
MTRAPGPVTVSASDVGGVCLLTAVGTLDSSNYLELRDRVIKAALDEPTAVLVDVGGLEVPARSAWSVFTSARWHVSVWPDIPIRLVCERPDTMARLSETGVTRYVPAHPNLETALVSLPRPKRTRCRVSAELPRRLSSLRRSRDFVAEWLSSWSQDQLIPTARVIVDVLVENVLRHTDSSPTVLLERAGSTVTIAVQDADAAPAVLHEGPDGLPARASGLAVVGAVCRAWGSTPTRPGKTVWAVIRPDSRL